MFFNTKLMLFIKRLRNVKQMIQNIISYDHEKFVKIASQLLAHDSK